jgi:hypothetical protein
MSTCVHIIFVRTRHPNAAAKAAVTTWQILNGRTAPRNVLLCLYSRNDEIRRPFTLSLDVMCSTDDIVYKLMIRQNKTSCTNLYCISPSRRAIPYSEKQRERERERVRGSEKV